jgi:D-alanyl-lipoteichoic acid acyltransferase DltB (MBOAT superfamily)
MLFNSLQFAIFLAAVLVAHRALPRRARIPLLLAASLLFYAFWYPPYLLLLLADVLVNYALLRAMARSPRPRIFLATSIVFTLGILAFTKYAGFVVETSLPALDLLFGVAPPIPEILLPLGISFYSFQIVALSVDTYRGRVEPVRRLSQYTLFICFFAQLIAGPILRGKQLLPQIEAGGLVTRDRTRRGVWLLASGVAKKVLLADFLLAGFVAEVFAAPGLASAPFHLVALYSFAFQIYFDFSGYTDMARGMALLLGFELPPNFREPYLSRNPAEFWRRWHITLSQWLRDYVYVPLGGNRRGPRRALINVAITMLLGGLWHGAGWNFVVWGGLHGILIIAHRLLAGGRSVEREVSLRDVPQTLLFFHAVCALWVFFRAPTFDEALLFYKGLLGMGSHSGWPLLQSAIVLLCFALHVSERWVRVRLPVLRASVERGPRGAALEGGVLGVLFALAVAVAGAGGEFIYFQF